MTRLHEDHEILWIRQVLHKVHEVLWKRQVLHAFHEVLEEYIPKNFQIREILAVKKFEHFFLVL